MIDTHTELFTRLKFVELAKISLERAEAKIILGYSLKAKTLEAIYDYDYYFAPEVTSEFALNFVESFITLCMGEHNTKHAAFLTDKQFTGWILKWCSKHYPEAHGLMDVF